MGKEVRVHSIENEKILEFDVIKDALKTIPHIKTYTAPRNVKWWLVENCEGNCYLLECSSHFLLKENCYIIMFENEIDAVFFKLVWG
jgi:hypothetical protein